MTKQHKCPRCGGHKFEVTTISTVRVDLSLCEAAVDFASIGWDEGMQCVCLDCGHDGLYRDFVIGAPIRDDEGLSHLLKHREASNDQNDKA